LLNPVNILTHIQTFVEVYVFGGGVLGKCHSMKVIFEHERRRIISSGLLIRDSLNLEFYPNVV